MVDVLRAWRGLFLLFCPVLCCLFFFALQMGVGGRWLLYFIYFIFECFFFFAGAVVWGEIDKKEDSNVIVEGKVRNGVRRMGRGRGCALCICSLLLCCYYRQWHVRVRACVLIFFVFGSFCSPFPLYISYIICAQQNPGKAQPLTSAPVVSLPRGSVYLALSLL